MSCKVIRVWAQLGKPGEAAPHGGRARFPEDIPGDSQAVADAATACGERGQRHTARSTRVTGEARAAA